LFHNVFFSSCNLVFNSARKSKPDTTSNARISCELLNLDPRMPAASAKMFPVVLRRLSSRPYNRSSGELSGV